MTTPSGPEDPNTRTPPHERTPITEADYVINQVTRLFVSHTGFRASAFKIKYVEALAREAATGDEIIKRVKDETALLDYMLASCAYALEAYRARECGDDESYAWTRIAEARHYLGYVSALVKVRAHPKAMAREVGSRGGRNSHSGDVAMAAEIRSWCESPARLAEFRGKGKGKGQSALARAAVAAKLNVMSFATVLRHMSGWAKDWRAAGLWDD